MKKYSFILSCALAVFAAAAVLSSCERDPQEKSVSTPTGVVTVKLGTGLQSTKASDASVRTGSTLENKLANVQILVFGQADGKLYRYGNFDSVSDGSDDFVIELPYGTYHVCAVANLASNSLSGIATKSEFDAYNVNYVPAHEGSSLSQTKLVQVGVSTLTLNSATAVSEVLLKRMCSRVRLKSLKTELPSAYSGKTVTFVRAFLANVRAGNINLAGTRNSSVWGNPYGRHAVHVNDITCVVGLHSPTIAPGVTAPSDGPVSLVYAESGANIGYNGTLAPGMYFYPWPNSGTVFENWHGVTTLPASNATVATVLVVALSIDGTLYYYPVALDAGPGLIANESYDVSMTITNLGVTTPDQPLLKGSATITVTVDAWDEGDEIIETL